MSETESKFSAPDWFVDDLKIIEMLGDRVSSVEFVRRENPFELRTIINLSPRESEVPHG